MVLLDAGGGGDHAATVAWTLGHLPLLRPALSWYSHSTLHCLYLSHSDIQSTLVTLYMGLSDKSQRSCVWRVDDGDGDYNDCTDPHLCRVSSISREQSLHLA